MSALLDPRPVGETGSTLSHWLRLLFDRAPPLRFDSEAPFIAEGAVHLPARSPWPQGAAAAAHAAAHLVYSPARFDGEGLVPIARALVGLLEDARVEALAMRELPGLARLWRPLHTVAPAQGCDLEALLQRLARALVDPGHDDPDAWVRKGRDLFFLDAGLGVPALRTPAEVRQAALRLGHDLGQMRLQLNAKSYRPAPDYRDDHRWMWAADVLAAAPPPAATSPAATTDDSEPMETLESTARVSLHPEWDRLIERLRPRWCRVVERHDVLAASAAGGPPLADVGGLEEPLRRLALGPGTSARHSEGEVFDPDALVEWRIARRTGAAADTRVYRGAARRPGRAAAWLLVDRSASTAAPLGPPGPSGPAGRSVLAAAAQAAAATARALQAIGVDCAIAAFDSHGRHAVRIGVVKGFDEAPSAMTAARLQALRPGGSTRLGAALRHATARLAARPPGPRWIVVFSDGEPHDTDVHDPRYLVEDARHAVREAARQGVQLACVALAARRGAEALRIFGGRRVRVLHEPQRLAAVFRQMLG